MFNIETLTEIAGSAHNTANLTVLTTEHCASLLIAESMLDMARPIRRLSSNERIAIQQQFNRSIAVMIKGADNSVKASLQELAVQAATRVQSAQQLGDDDAIEDAVQRLERVINLFTDLASNVCRNGFYRHEECERMETAVHDSHVDGIDGAIGAFETKSKYAGWKQVSVESDMMKESTQEAIDGLISVIKALLPLASAYMQGLFRNNKGEVIVQLGYQRLPESKDNDVEYEQYYSLQDTWNSISANRREIRKVMSAEESVAAFKL